jgi:hypothetical protein
MYSRRRGQRLKTSAGASLVPGLFFLVFESLSGPVYKIEKLFGAH